MEREPRVFISHSWADKPVARRVARRLGHRGVGVWLDEEELQLGDQLSARIRAEIESCTHLMVLWSESAARSSWVRKEIDFARGVDPPLIVVPAWLDESAADELLDDSLGLSLADRYRFENELERLARAILGREVRRDRDREQLRRDLEAIGREALDLQALIEQLCEHGQIAHAQVEAAHITAEKRHEAETALVALHEYLDADKNGRYVVSLLAANFFLEHGVGHAVLERQIAREPHDSSELAVMFGHLGERCRDPAFIDPVIALFQQVRPPQDQHFYSFVRENVDQLGEDQRNRAVAFATTPNRGPGGFAADLAFQLYKHLPENEAIRQLWWWWIQEYRFGGKPDAGGAPENPRFFRLMNEAHEEGLEQFDDLMDHYEVCFRRQATTGKRRDIETCVDVLLTADRTKYHRRGKLIALLRSRMGSAEWNPLPQAYVIALDDLLDALREDRDWAEALRHFTSQVE